jgi:hypothetical protein
MSKSAYQQTLAPELHTTGDTTPFQHTVWDFAVTTSGLRKSSAETDSRQYG